MGRNARAAQRLSQERVNARPDAQERVNARLDTHTGRISPHIVDAAAPWRVSGRALARPTCRPANLVSSRKTIWGRMAMEFPRRRFLLLAAAAAALPAVPRLA